MTDKDLDELSRLAEAATPGPWYQPEGEKSICGWDGDVNVWEVAIHVEDPDAAFIIAARDSVPLLIERIRELEDTIRKACGFCCGYLEMRCDKCPLYKK